MLRYRIGRSFKGYALSLIPLDEKLLKSLIHFIEGTEPIFEKRIKTGQADKIRSYVYAGVKLIARVDEVIGNSAAKKYWYHTDHLGSVKAVTNNLGIPVWKADYFSFGQQYGKEKIDPTFEEDDLGFTGKGFDHLLEQERRRYPQQITPMILKIIIN